MKIGPYETVRELGRGANGVVLEARDSQGREVALKVLHRSQGDALARFTRESKLLQSLGRAEGFVPLLDAGDSPKGPWIALELIPGGTLRARLEKGRLSLDESIAIADALARALSHAHALGIVHRDLKPENVLFTTDGRPLVTDLGIAKQIDGGASAASLSHTGSFRGSAGYLSPEQASDAKSVGSAADVFAWGAIVYECLAGEPPFRGNSIVELLTALENGRFVPLGRARADAPPWLVSVVERALAHDPEQRFQDGAELVTALARPPKKRTPLVAVGAIAAIGAGVAVALLRPNAPPETRNPPTTPPQTAPAPAPKQKTGDREAARTAVERAKALREKGDRAGALAEATRAVALDPTFVEAHIERGFAHSREEPALALEDFERALALAPDAPGAHSGKGYCLTLLREKPPTSAPVACYDRAPCRTRSRAGSSRSRRTERASSSAPVSSRRSSMRASRIRTPSSRARRHRD